MSEIPAWLIYAKNKANEFEHGLMLGMMLVPAKGSAPHTTKTSDERTLSDGTILKTWIEVTKEPTVNANKDAYEMAWGLFQQKTYTDGTIEKVTVVSDFTTIHGYGNTAYIDKDVMYNWELDEPNSSGIIQSSSWYKYNFGANTITKTSVGTYLHWSIDTNGG